jgi:hypothetical protein
LDGVGASTGIVEIIIQDAPSLERLVFPEVHQGLRVSVIAGAAPKLETLGCIYDVDPSSRFVFGSMVIQVRCHFSASCISMFRYFFLTLTALLYINGL